MLKGKYLKFAENILKCLTPRQAYIKAGYKARGNSADAAASRLLKHVKVAKYLEERQKVLAGQLQEETLVTKKEAVIEARRLGLVDVRKFYHADGRQKHITELDDDTAAAVAGFEVENVYEGIGENRRLVGEIFKYKLASKNDALEKIFKHLGLYAPEQSNHSVNVNVTIRRISS